MVTDRRGTEVSISEQHLLWVHLLDKSFLNLPEFRVIKLLTKHTGGLTARSNAISSISLSWDREKSQLQASPLVLKARPAFVWQTSPTIVGQPKFTWTRLKITVMDCIRIQLTTVALVFQRYSLLHVNTQRRNNAYKCGKGHCMLDTSQLDWLVTMFCTNMRRMYFATFCKMPKRQQRSCRKQKTIKSRTGV